MKNKNKFISIILSAALVFTGTVTFAWAADTNNDTENRGVNYLCVGDSLASGYNAAGYSGEYDEDHDFSDTENNKSYGSKLNQFFITTSGKQGEYTYNATCPALRMKDLAAALYGETFLDDYNSGNDPYLGNRLEKIQQDESLRTAIANADVITIHLGSNELCCYLQSRISYITNDEYTSFGAFTEAFINNQEEILAKLPTYLPRLIECANESLLDFAESWNAINDYIRKNNDNNPTILYMGVYNNIGTMVEGFGADESVAWLCNYVAGLYVFAINQYVENGNADYKEMAKMLAGEIINEDSFETLQDLDVLGLLKLLGVELPIEIDIASLSPEELKTISNLLEKNINALIDSIILPDIPENKYSTMETKNMAFVYTNGVIKKGLLIEGEWAHPNEEGHNHLYEQVINALGENADCPHAICKEIGKYPATPSSDGYTLLKCGVCGNDIKTDIIPKLETKARTSKLPCKVKQKFNAASNLVIAKGDSVAKVSTSNKKYVSVSGTTVKGLKKGKTATITVKMKSGATVKYSVKVQSSAVKASSIKLSSASKLTLKKGSKSQIKATKSAPITCKYGLKYSSSKKSVATVSSKGVITAKKKGTAKIYVKCTGAKTKTIKVTVQ